MDTRAGVHPVELADIQPHLKQQHCPECGNTMKPVDGLKQQDVIYIWYRCTTKGCKGSYLEKLTKKAVNGS